VFASHSRSILGTVCPISNTGRGSQESSTQLEYTSGGAFKTGKAKQRAGKRDMKECEHPLKSRAYGSVLIGFIHREVELCQQCQHFRLLDNPLRGWLVLTHQSTFENQELQAAALSGVSQS